MGPTVAVPAGGAARAKQGARLVAVIVGPDGRAGSLKAVSLLTVAAVVASLLVALSPDSWAPATAAAALLRAVACAAEVVGGVVVVGALASACPAALAVAVAACVGVAVAAFMVGVVAAAGSGAGAPQGSALAGPASGSGSAIRALGSESVSETAFAGGATRSVIGAFGVGIGSDGAVFASGTGTRTGTTTGGTGSAAASARTISTRLGPLGGRVTATASQGAPTRAIARPTGVQMPIAFASEAVWKEVPQLQERVRRLF